MLAVAHFRRTLFGLTETFLYNYLVAFRRTLPVGITYCRKNREFFPYDLPLVELYPQNPWSRGWRWVRRSIRHQPSASKYDVARTYRALDEFDIGVLHTHFGFTGVRVMPVKAKTGLPLVTTFYGVDISARAQVEDWHKAYQLLFAEGDLFLVEGPFMRDRLVDLGCPLEKTGIQRIAIPVEDYPFRLRQPKARNEPVRILFCGRFAEKKGLPHALTAVRHAHEHYPNIEFNIIGDGEQRLQIETQIEQGRMGAYTRILGYQPHRVMLEAMAEADILLSPSIVASNGDSEGGAPTTLLEAQACGLPILASTHADIPNVVLPGKSALLAPEGDTDLLSQLLITLLESPEQWSAMGQQGRRFVQEHHDITRQVDLLEERYHRLVSASA